MSSLSVPEAPEHGHAAAAAGSGQRIAYLVNQYPAVSHTFIRREIRAMERRGIHVDRLALRGWDATLVEAEDIEERDRTRYTQKDGIAALIAAVARTALARPGRFLRALGLAVAMSRNAVRPWPYHLVYLAQACRIRAWLAETGAVHLHAHFGTNPAEIALLTRVLGGPPFSFTIHGRNETDGAARLHFDRKVAGAAFVAAISDFTRSQMLREIAPSLWPKVRVVHCGLTDDFFPGTVPPPPDTPVFLTIGRLSPEKGHLILLDAFAAVLEACPGARLVIAGDGDMRPAIEARIAALGIAGAVEMTGWIDAAEVRRRLGAATALVQPSFIEGLPVVIMEAMAMQRAVISTYVAGIPELVVPDRTGWLVPAGNIEALAGAMRQAAGADAGRLAAMGLAARDRVRDRHHIDREAGRLARLIFGAAQ